MAWRARVIGGGAALALLALLGQPWREPGENAAPGGAAARRVADSPVLALARDADVDVGAGASTRLAAVPASRTTGDGRPAAPGAAISIEASASASLKVGETGELSIAMDARRPLGDVNLTVRFDPDLLQARDAAEGNAITSGKVTAGFGARVSDSGDSVEIRLRPATPAVLSGDGPVAVVRFQAMAPGRAAVIVEHVKVTDPDGQALPFVLSRADVSVQVLSEAF